MFIPLFLKTSRASSLSCAMTHRKLKAACMSFTWDVPYTITTTVQVKSCREICKFSEPTILPSPNSIILKFRDEQPNLVDTFEI
jgi:hypothetical protein